MTSTYELAQLGQIFGSMLAVMVVAIGGAAGREWWRLRPARVRAQHRTRTAEDALSPAEAAEVARITDGYAIAARDHLAALDEPLEPTPIHDELMAEWPALLEARKRALRTPTQELFAAIVLAEWTDDEVDRLAELAEPCSHCEPAELVLHRDCPGCACPCTLELETAGAR